MLRLKSNRMLRNYKTNTKRLQRCSKCKQIGHNSSNKRCPSNVDLSDMVEDDEVEDDRATGEEDDLTESVFADEDDNFNIDELLYSDEELF